MPPRRPPSPRCCYLVRGRACAKPAIGNPPLCAQHGDEDSETANELLESVLARPEVQGIFNRFNAILDRGVSYIDHATTRAATSPPSAGKDAPPPRPATPRRESARVILGFAPDAKLTVELVKQRRRELAKLFHPDHAGSTEAMARVNRAAELLLAQLTVR